MKKLGIILVGLVFLFPGIVSAAEEFPLMAGQNLEVGYVAIWNDNDYVYVKYVITDDNWCITETHLQVAASLEGIPQKNGNPIPGKFDQKGVHECVSEVNYAVPIAESDKIYVAAHAVVKELSCYDTAILYGLQRNSGVIYSVDVLSGASVAEFSVVAPPVASAKPNGLAYDGVSGRMYYCDYQYTTTLYFWDGVENVAGPLTVEIAAADCYGGKYYYIDSAPPGTDDLYEVAFNPDGTIATNIKLLDISGNAHGWTFNGDIAVKDGIVYGWGYCGTHKKYEFFTYDLATSAFNLTQTSYQASLQLAFGSDGILYGHRSGGSGPFFVVDVTNGGVTSVGIPPGLLFTDCASGRICEPTYETAWGDGYEFTGKNWATYIEYLIPTAE